MVKGTKKGKPSAPGKTKGRKAEAAADGSPPSVALPPEPTVVGIGASAGGIEALMVLLKGLPERPGMAFVVVLHLDPRQKSHLTEILSKVCRFPVAEARHGEPVLPDRVYVIPPDRDLILSGGAIQILPREEKRRIHLPVDSLFLSLARTLGERAIGVILSGSGRDGAVGIKEIKERGGITFAQTENTAKQTGMPLAAVETGSVDFVLPPREIAEELAILSRTHTSGLMESPSGIDQKLKMEVLGLLRDATEVDFSQYKQTTLWRRVSRRMSLKRILTLREYVEYLKATPAEVGALYQDILINVTGFFRDAEVFQVLKQDVFPKLIKGRGSEDPIRIWVPGCSTGEEVYSIAMTLLEVLAENPTGIAVQIFGTDINESVVDRARLGIYTERITETVSEERLHRFFVKLNRGYQITKTIRDMCVFARQNVIGDPPLSRMDLISCRNLLIYLAPPLQKRVIPRFHYALKPDGLLLLGKSEVVELFSDLFHVVDKRSRLYRRRASPNRALLEMGAGRPASRAETPRKGPVIEGFFSEGELNSEVDRLILNRFTPPSIVFNRDLEILQFRGEINAYLDLSSRRPALNLAKVVQHSFVKQVRDLVDQAVNGERKLLSLEGVRLQYNRGFRRVNVRLAPLKGGGGKEHFLLWLEEIEEPRGEDNGEGLRAGHPHREQGEEVRRLEDELTATREYLQAIVDERELKNEELQSANEEVLSSNEELQTMNQELETSKEELESANEELATLNEELQHRLEQLRQTEERLRILVSQVKEYAIFMLDTEGNILSWNEGAERIKGYKSHEIIGRNFSSFYPAEVARSGKPRKELKVAAEKGFYQEEGIRVRKDGSRFWANVVITALFDETQKLCGYAKVTRDISDRKRAEEALKKANEDLERKVRERTEELAKSNESLRAEVAHRRETEKLLKERETLLRLVTDANPALVAYLDAGERYRFSNETYRKWFGLFPDHMPGKPLREVVGESAYGTLRPLVRKALSGEPASSEVLAAFPQGGSRYIQVNCIPDRDDGGAVRGVVTLIEDISARRNYEEELRRQAVDLVRINRELSVSNEELSQFAHVSSHDLREPLRMVKTYTQLLRLKYGEGLTGDASQYMDFIVEGASRMDALITDLLAFSAVGRAEAPPAEVDLNRVAAAVRDTLGEVIAEARAEVVLDPLPKVKGNETQLGQLLQNLISNALKFRGKDPVKVRLWSEPREGEWVIGVTDNGIGIEPEYRERIFVIFQRLHSRKEYPGTGIGLAICKKIVERHEGRIWVESDPGKGTTFFFTLPERRT